MIKSVLPIALLLLLVTAVTSHADPASEVVAAHAVWRDALLARDGSAAWERVDRRTRDFCDDVLRHTWDADRQALALLPVTAVVLVVQARNSLPRGELLALNGEGFFHHAVRNGWLDSGLLEGQTIEDVRVDGDTATGVQRVGEQTYPIALRFSFESEVWRVDMTTSVKETHAAFVQQARQSGMTPLELVLQLLEVQSGEPVPAIALEPLRQ